jgi:hypothetical protein
MHPDMKMLRAPLARKYHHRCWRFYTNEGKRYYLTVVLPPELKVILPPLLSKLRRCSGIFPDKENVASPPAFKGIAQKFTARNL